jgi:hypothetical protein
VDGSVQWVVGDLACESNRYHDLVKYSAFLAVSAEQRCEKADCHCTVDLLVSAQKSILGCPVNSQNTIRKS